MAHELNPKKPKVFHSEDSQEKINTEENSQYEESETSEIVNFDNENNSVEETVENSEEQDLNYSENNSNDSYKTIDETFESNKVDLLDTQNENSQFESDEESDISSQHIDILENASLIKNTKISTATLIEGKTIIKLGQITAKIIPKQSKNCIIIPSTSKQNIIEKSRTKIIENRIKIKEASSSKKENRAKSTKVVKEVTVPNFIKIQQVDVFQSRFGMFPCSLRQGIYGSTFVEADEYLFLFGLMKNNIR